MADDVVLTPVPRLSQSLVDVSRISSHTHAPSHGPLRDESSDGRHTAERSTMSVHVDAEAHSNVGVSVGANGPSFASPSALASLPQDIPVTENPTATVGPSPRTGRQSPGAAQHNMGDESVVSLVSLSFGDTTVSSMAPPSSHSAIADGFSSKQHSPRHLMDGRPEMHQSDVVDVLFDTGAPSHSPRLDRDASVLSGTHDRQPLRSVDPNCAAPARGSSATNRAASVSSISLSGSGWGDIAPTFKRSIAVVDPYGEKRPGLTVKGGIGAYYGAGGSGGTWRTRKFPVPAPRPGFSSVMHTGAEENARSSLRDSDRTSSIDDASSLLV